MIKTIFNNLQKLNLGTDYWNNLYYENTTPKEFTSWATKHSNQIKKALKEYGFTHFEKVSKGYFEYSLFAKSDKLGWVYLSISDVRSWDLDDILIRSAEGPKDFSGGSNDYLSFKSAESFENSFDRVVQGLESMVA